MIKNIKDTIRSATNYDPTNKNALYEQRNRVYHYERENNFFNVNTGERYKGEENNKNSTKDKTDLQQKMFQIMEELNKKMTSIFT